MIRLEMKELTGWLCVTVWTVSVRPMAAVPPKALRAWHPCPPQQAGPAHVLVPRLSGLSRECTAHPTKCSHHQEHRVQLHTVSTATRNLNS